MARAAIRSTTGSRGKKTRYSGKLARRTVAKTATKKRASSVKTPVLYVGAMSQYFTQLAKYSAQRVADYGKSDAHAKRLNNYMKSARVQLRTKNFVNPKSIAILKNIQTTINGLPSAPKSLKSHIPSFFKTAKVNVNKDIISFLNTLNKTLHSFNGEMVRWESALKGQYAFAQSGKRRYIIDAALKRQIVSFEKKFITFKKKWDLRLNKLSLHANRSLQSAIKKSKKEMDIVRKQIHTNVVLVNKIIRLGQAKKVQGVKQYTLVTKRDFAAWNNGFTKHASSLEQFRLQVAQYLEQLKAIKLV